MVLGGGFQMTNETYVCLHRTHSLMEETVALSVVTSNRRGTEIWGHDKHLQCRLGWMVGRRLPGGGETEAETIR